MTGESDMKQTGLFDNDHTGSRFSDICASFDMDGSAPAWPDTFGKQLARYLERNKIPPIRTLSLFSGAGGLDIGFSDAGKGQLYRRTRLRRKRPGQDRLYYWRTALSNI